MDDQDKLERTLVNLDLSFEKIAEGTWLINDSAKGLMNVLVAAAAPYAVVRVNVMNVPAKNREAFFETVLKLNATDLAQGAYAVDNGKLILMNSHNIPTLDLEEMQGTLDTFSLALSQHFPILSKYRD